MRIPRGETTTSAPGPVSVTRQALQFLGPVLGDDDAGWRDSFAGRGFLEHQKAAVARHVVRAPDDSEPQEVVGGEERLWRPGRPVDSVPRHAPHHPVKADV